MEPTKDISPIIQDLENLSVNKRRKISPEDSLVELFQSKNPAAVDFLATHVENELPFEIRFLVFSHLTNKDELQRKVLNIAFNCMCLDRDKIDPTAETQLQSLSLDYDQKRRSIEIIHAVNAAYNLFNAIDPDIRTHEVLKELIKFFRSLTFRDEWITNKDLKGPYDVPLIELFKNIPPDEQEEILYYGFNISFSFGQEPQDICSVFKTLLMIPRDRRDEIFELAYPYLSDYPKDARSCAKFLEGLSQLDNLKELLSSAQGILYDKPAWKLDNILHLFQALANLSSDQRNKLIEMAIDTYSGYRADVYGDRRVSFIETMKLLPETEWDNQSNIHTIRYYTNYITSEARNVLSQSLAKLPPDQLIDTLRLGCLLFQERYESEEMPDEINAEIQLFKPLIDECPKEFREKYIQKALNIKIENLNIPKNIVRKLRIDFLRILLLLPEDVRDHSEDFLQHLINIYPNHNPAREEIIKILSRIPPEERFTLLTQCYNALVSHSMADLPGLLSIISEAPQRERQEIFDYIKTDKSQFGTIEYVKALLQFPRDLRPDICKYAFPTFIPIYYDYLLYSLSKIPSEEKQEIFDCLRTFKQITLNNITEYIDALLQYPAGQRMEIFKKTEGFNYQVLCIHELRKINHPKDKVIEYAKKSDEGGSIRLKFLQLVALLPEDQRNDETLSRASGFCAKQIREYNLNLDALFEILLQFNPEQRVNILSWFYTMSSNELYNDCMWVVLMNPKEKNEKIRERYADKSNRQAPDVNEMDVDTSSSQNPVREVEREI